MNYEELELLSNEELFPLALENEEIKNYMFERNYPLIVHCADKYRNKGLTSFEDAVSLCGLAVTKAFVSYKPELNIKYSTYASQCMMNALFNLTHRTKERLKIAQFTSVNNKIKGMEDEEFLDFIIVENTHSDDFAKSEELKDILEIFSKIMTDEEKVIFKHRFVEGTGCKELGKIMGLSHQGVLNKQNLIIKKMRKIKDEITKGNKQMLLENIDIADYKKITKYEVFYIFKNYPFLKKFDVQKITGIERSKLYRWEADYKMIEDIGADFPNTFDKKVQSYMAFNGLETPVLI